MAMLLFQFVKGTPDHTGPGAVTKGIVLTRDTYLV